MTDDVAGEGGKGRHYFALPAGTKLFEFEIGSVLGHGGFVIIYKAIDTDLVLRVLTPLWKTRTETGKRLRGRIERVLAWAKGRGLRTGENPARWRGHLEHMLPKKSKISPVEHHKALPYSELPAYVAQLRQKSLLLWR